MALVVRNRAVQWVEANVKSWDKECGSQKVTVSGLICGFLDGDVMQKISRRREMQDYIVKGVWYLSICQSQ